MANLSITNGFDSLSDPALLTRAYQIETGVTTYATDFPTPKPTLPEMTGIIGAYFNALTASKDGDRLKIAIKNQRRAELITALHLWGAYVLSQSGGDPVIAQSSNFTIRKTASPRPPILKPEGFSIVAGSNPFTMLGQVNKVAGAKTYVFQYATDEMMAQDTWLGVPTTSKKCTLQSLASGVVYNFRVAAVGPREQIMYSDILRSRVA